MFVSQKLDEEFTHSEEKLTIERDFESTHNFSQGFSHIKDVPVFQPKKFVPVSNESNNDTSKSEAALGIKAVWSPLGKKESEPAYRKIQPNLHQKY